jgi:hypothetical protein
VNYGDREKFAAVIEELVVLYDIELRVGRGQLYWDGLQSFSLAVVQEAARDLRATCKRFPTLAEWHEQCRAVAARRARAQAPSRETAEPGEPATWNTTASSILVFAALAGVEVRDNAIRARAREIIHDELRAGLREEFNSPRDVPSARRTAERRRIVQLLVRELLAGEASSVESP